VSQLTRLREDHAKLARLFGDLGEMVSRSEPPPQVQLFELRHNLVSMLLAHLKLEDWALYPRLIGSGQVELAAAGMAFKDEMGGLAPAFIAYCDKWGAIAIEEDWSGYCEDTRAMLDGLMNRLLRENRELLPLLERLDQEAA
jgi:hypothetical protein